MARPKLSMMMTGSVALRCGASVFFGVPVALGLSAGTADADSTCDERSCVPNIGQGVTIGDQCGTSNHGGYYQPFLLPSNEGVQRKNTALPFVVGLQGENHVFHGRL